MENKIKRLVIITIGIFIVSIGIYYLWTPYDLAPGGLAGMTIILKSFIPGLSVSHSITIINIILLILGAVFIGRDFAGYTIYTSILLSLFTLILERYFPLKEPVVNSIFLNLVFGSVFVGTGVGIVFNQGASTGGSDIIAKIISIVWNTTISQGIFIADAVITVVAIFQIGLEKGMYSLIGIVVSTYMINLVTEGINRRIEMKIISSKFEEINIFLNKEIGRGTTIFHVSGGFSQEERKMIYTVVERKDYIRAKEYISEIDPTAFVIIGSVNEVVGEGFTYERLL